MMTINGALLILVLA